MLLCNIVQNSPLEQNRTMYDSRISWRARQNATARTGRYDNRHVMGFKKGPAQFVWLSAHLTKMTTKI